VELGFEAFVIIQLCVSIEPTSSWTFPYSIWRCLHKASHPPTGSGVSCWFLGSSHCSSFFQSTYAPRSILFFADSEHFLLPSVVLRKMDSSRYAPAPLVSVSFFWLMISWSSMSILSFLFPSHPHVNPLVDHYRLCALTQMRWDESNFEVRPHHICSEFTTPWRQSFPGLTLEFSASVEFGIDHWSVRPF